MSEAAPKRQKGDPPDPNPDDGFLHVDGPDDPSLPDPQPDGGRGPGWATVYPAKARRCNAHSKQRTKAARKAGLIGEHEMRRCRAVATKESDKCRFHGGVAKKRRDGKGGWNGHIVDGRYSKRLGRLRQAYEAAMTSPTLFDLREGIAAMDACVQSMMERVDERDTPNFRARALALFREARRAMDEGRGTDAATHLAALGDLLEQGASADESLGLLVRSVETLQKRVEKAWEIKLNKDDTLNTRDLLAILGNLIEIIMDEAGGQLGMRIVGRLDTSIRGYGTGLSPAALTTIEASPSETSTEASSPPPGPEPSLDDRSQDSNSIEIDP